MPSNPTPTGCTYDFHGLPTFSFPGRVLSECNTAPAAKPLTPTRITFSYSLFFFSLSLLFFRFARKISCALKGYGDIQCRLSVSTTSRAAPYQSLLTQTTINTYCGAQGGERDSFGHLVMFCGGYENMTILCMYVFRYP